MDDDQNLRLLAVLRLSQLQDLYFLPFTVIHVKRRLWLSPSW